MARRKIRKNAFVKVKDKNPSVNPSVTNRFTKFFGTVIRVQERRNNEILIGGTSIWLPLRYIEKVITKEENPEYYL